MERTKPVEVGSIGASREHRPQLRALIASGRWRPAEPDAPRAAAFDAARETTASAEAIVGDTNGNQDIASLHVGSRVRRALANAESSDARESRMSTGFRISDGRLRKSQHVTVNADAAREAQITFDRETVASGAPCATTSFQVEPDGFALSSGANELDHAPIDVGSRNCGSAALAEVDFCPTSGSESPSPLRTRVSFEERKLRMQLRALDHARSLAGTVARRLPPSTFS